MLLKDIAKKFHFKNMKKMKKIIVYLALFLYSGIATAQNSLTLEIAGVKKQGGKLYVSLFNSEQSLKEKKIYHSLVTNSIDETLNVELNLPEGEYFFSVYQDNNSNGELDTGIMGIPKELFGFSNYDGKSVPGNFNRHKVLVNENTKKIAVHLYKI
ncbi:MAG: DUF2141 domain-containing protein [Bacteroidetes bacterium]|nr:MAG: DUF2141 domain-containing protein [Bacteroidota bacterium]